MANPHAAGAAPTARNVTVRSRQPRDYLTLREIERLIEAERGNRWGHRDATAILMAYYLGHRSIVSTVRYTALAPDRFKGFWRD